MNSLQLNNDIRLGGPNRTERHYLDFNVSGISLKKILGIEDADYITLFGWGSNRDYDRHILNVFRMKQRSKLETGRIMLYVCPECGDIDCGAITADIMDFGAAIVWRDFGYETGYGGITEKYTGIAPIEFDRQSYFAAFSKLS